MCGHGEHVGRKHQDNQSPIQYSVFVHKKALHVLVMLRVIYKKEKPSSQMPWKILLLLQQWLSYTLKDR